MLDRRLALTFSILYGVALAALAIAQVWIAFVVVAVIGGPTTSVLWRLAIRGERAKRNA